MFTTVDKAFAALFGALVFLLQTYFKIDLNFVTADTIEKLVPFLTTVLVYLIPNKKL